MDNGRRLLHVVADRQHWHAALAEARRRSGLTSNNSATNEAA
jgi:hypothetical protein